MSKLHKGERKGGISGKLKHLKTGDMFDIQSGKDTCQSFTVLGADIVHKSHPDIACTNKMVPPSTLKLTSNYPFGRRNGDTPLRYVIYAEQTT